VGRPPVDGDGDGDGDGGTLAGRGWERGRRVVGLLDLCHLQSAWCRDFRWKSTTIPRGRGPAAKLDSGQGVDPRRESRGDLKS
jgi:hypothetical protein